MSEADNTVKSILKRPLLCAEWTTVIPDEGKRTLSPKFYLNSVECQFKLEVVEELCLDVIRTDGLDISNVSEYFKCTVIVSQVDMKFQAPFKRERIDPQERYFWFYEEKKNGELKVLQGKTISFLVVLEADGKTAQGEKGSDWSENLKSLQSLSQDFAKLMNDTPIADIKLLCGDLTIPAHGNVLSARSEVFGKMLQTDMVEKRTGSINIPDIQPEVIKEFLRYIYSGTLPEMTVEKAMQLYGAGDKYNVRCLVEECASYLGSSLTEDNVCEIMALADDHSDPELKERAITFISKEEIPLKPDFWEKLRDQRRDLTIEVMRRAYKDLKDKSTE